MPFARGLGPEPYAHGSSWDKKVGYGKTVFFTIFQGALYIIGWILMSVSSLWSICVLDFVFRQNLLSYTDRGEGLLTNMSIVA